MTDEDVVRLLAQYSDEDLEKLAAFIDQAGSLEAAREVVETLDCLPRAA